MQEQLPQQLVRLCVVTVNEWVERLAMTGISLWATDAPPRARLKVAIRVAEAALLLKTLALAVLQGTTALAVSPQPVDQVHGQLLKRRPAPHVKPALLATDSV